MQFWGGFLFVFAFFNDSLKIKFLSDAGRRFWCLTNIHKFEGVQITSFPSESSSCSLSSLIIYSFGLLIKNW